VAEVECLPVRAGIARTQTGEDCGASWQDVWALTDITEAKGKEGREIEAS
jgi:hypothetical protein